MKVIKILLNVIGVMIASFLSFVLVFVLLGAPVVNGVANLTKPEKITEMITSIDYTEFINKNEVISESLGELGYDAEIINTVLTSEVTADIIELYTTDLTAMLSGEEVESSFTRDKIMSIIDENMDLLVQTVREAVPEADDLTDAEIADALDQLAEESVDAVLENVPTVDQLATEIGAADALKTVSTVYKVANKSLMPIVYGVIAALALFIFLFRIYRFRGFMWLGLVFSLAAVICTVIIFASGALVDAICASVGEEIASFLSSAPGIVSSTYSPFAVGYGVTGVAFILLFIAIKILASSMKKKKAAKLAAAEAAVADAPTTSQAETGTADGSSVEAPAASDGSSEQ